MSDHEKAAEDALKPKRFRVVQRNDGFTVESSVVPYWDAVHAVAELMRQLAEREADDAKRSQDGRTDWDYQQRIDRAERAIQGALSCVGDSNSILDHLRAYVPQPRDS